MFDPYAYMIDAIMPTTPLTVIKQSVVLSVIVHFIFQNIINRNVKKQLKVDYRLYGARG